MENTSRRNSAVIGTLILGLGLVLLLGQLFSFNVFNLFQNWDLPYPVYILALGVILIVIGLLGRQNWLGFTIVGSIVAVSGALLAFQDATQDYQTWAYLWALVFPGSIGVALTLHGISTQDNQRLRAGLRTIGVALVLTLIGWSFFEGVIDLSGYHLDRITHFAGPLLLILIGGWLVLGRQSPTKNQEVIS